MLQTRSDGNESPEKRAGGSTLFVIEALCRFSSIACGGAGGEARLGFPA